MKSINTIVSLSVKEQYAIKRWYIISIVIMIGFFVTMIAVEIPQLYALKKIIEEKDMISGQVQQCDELLKTHDIQKDTVSMLQKKKVIFNTYNMQMNHMVSMLKLIHSACGTTVIAIDQLDIKKDAFVINARCNNMQQVAGIVAYISESNLVGDCILTSLVQIEDNAMVSFSMRARNIL